MYTELSHQQRGHTERTNRNVCGSRNLYRSKAYRATSLPDNPKYTSPICQYACQSAGILINFITFSQMRLQRQIKQANCLPTHSLNTAQTAYLRIKLQPVVSSIKVLRFFHFFGKCCSAPDFSLVLSLNSTSIFHSPGIDVLSPYSSVRPIL